MNAPPIASGSTSRIVGGGGGGGGERVGDSPSSSLLVSPYLIQPTNLYPSPLSGTKDLITLFNLDPLYNTFLRPYLPPSTSTTTTSSKEKEQEKEKGSKGKGKVILDSPTPTTIQSPKQGGPYAVASPAPPGGGGFKITLGGIRLNSHGTGGTGIVSSSGASGNGGKVKRIKMEKNYSHMIQDVLGRNSIKKDQFLTRLVLNPDPPPEPRLFVVPDEQLLRDGLSLKIGGLAGFDMGLWENDDLQAGEDNWNGGKKKKKKRKQQQQQQQDGVGGESDRKKQKQ